MPATNFTRESTKRFAYRVECEIDKITVDRTGAGPPTAQAEIGARFLDLRGGKETPAWEITVTARFVPGDDGWRIRRRATTFMRKHGGFDSGRQHDPLADSD